MSRSMFVDVCSPSTIDVDGGCARFIPAQLRLVARALPVSGYHFHRLVEDCKSHRRRQAQVGRKDIIFIKYPLATAKDLPKGL